MRRRCEEKREISWQCGANMMKNKNAAVAGGTPPQHERYRRKGNPAPGETDVQFRSNRLPFAGRVQHQRCSKKLAGKVLDDIGRFDFNIGSYLKQ